MSVRRPSKRFARLASSPLAALAAAVFSLVVAFPLAAQAGGPSLRLSATVDGGSVQAEGCLGSRCSRQSFAWPEDLATPRVVHVSLEGGRPALLVESEGKTGVGRFVVVLAANDEGAAQELLRGWIDRPKGGPGASQTRVLLREPARGGESISFATRYDAVSVCGRPALMHVQQLDAASLEWTRTPTRTLSAAERDAAARLFATRTQKSLDGLPRLFVSTVATSAVGASHSGLTDGALEHGWTEKVAGVGTGEAVVMNSSSDVTIDGFQFVLRGRGASDVAAPRTLFVVTDSESFLVTMPEDAALQPEGTLYEVSLASPLRTECAAVVLEAAYDARGDEVGLAEFRARTTLDGAGGYPELVVRLERSGEEGRAAAALLARSGSAAVQATMAGFDALSESGRERALDVIDSGACEETARFHVEHLLGRGRAANWDPDGDESLDATRERVRRCREQSLGILGELTHAGGDDRSRGLAARELATLAPAASIAAIASALDGASAPLRARFRDAFAAAARDPRASTALGEAFESQAFSARSVAVRLELLRALGAHLGAVPAARLGFESLTRETSFRTRYLLQEPAAQLARAGDSVAVRFLTESIVRDPSPHVRAQAAQAAAALPGLVEPLGLALDDASPRVREAALGALATANAPLASPRVAKLLTADPWTFVRIAAATALGAQSPTDAGAAALVRAIDDPAVAVRRAAILALGATRDSAAGERIAEVAENASQDTEVRMAAVTALGRTCHSESLDYLYKLALRTGAPELGYDKQLGMAALSALAELRPSDRAERLQPILRDGRASVQVKAIVREVIARTGSCGR